MIQIDVKREGEHDEIFGFMDPSFKYSFGMLIPYK